MNLKGKVAIVTGGAVGIGRAISLKLATLGAKLIVNYNTSSQKARELVEEIKALGFEADCIQADISKFDQAEKLINFAIERFGQIDILVNNAGVTADNLILRMKEEDFDKVIEINLKGTWNCCKHASRIMSKQRSGKIINISSVVALMGNIGQTNYCASKAGIIGLTKALSRELGKRGVSVNAVAPGFIQTKMTENLPQEMVEQVLNNIPLARLGAVEDIAEVVGFLASDSANYITGQVINVDGGLYMN